MAISIQSANRLRWANPPVNFAVASRLFLNLYSTREESESFYAVKNCYDSECLSATPDLPELSSKLRGVFNLRELGTTRERTNQLMTSFLVTCLPVALIVAIKRYRHPSSRRFVESPAIRDAFQGFMRYRHVYLTQYARKSMGGVWVPQSLSIKEHVLSLTRGISASKFFLDDRIPFLMEYMTRVTELCYKSRLGYWWIPMYILMDNITRWAGPVPKDELGTPTIDGMLGVIFPKKFTDGLVVTQNGEIVSNDSDVYNEYAFISMSDKERFEALGCPGSKRAKRLLTKLGYTKAPKYRINDFHMLFDRLIAQKSVEWVAEKYKCEEATVKRRTKKIANVLMIKLPVAPHKKHRRN